MIQASRIRALRRMMAAVLAAALLSAGPVGIPRGCVECPPGCPMHAQRDQAPARKQPGCHRTAERLPAGTVCLRSACGHDVASDSVSVVGLLVRPPFISSSAPGTRIATPPLVVASLDAPEPPLHPPRAARA